MPFLAGLYFTYEHSFLVCVVNEFCVSKHYHHHHHKGIIMEAAQAAKAREEAMLAKQSKVNMFIPPTPLPLY
jgi:hypothetical protein